MTTSTKTHTPTEAEIRAVREYCDRAMEKKRREEARSEGYRWYGTGGAAGSTNICWDEKSGDGQQRYHWRRRDEPFSPVHFHRRKGDAT